jgi:hypothetical protein
MATVRVRPRRGDGDHARGAIAAMHQMSLICTPEQGPCRETSCFAS